jgi:hypothetical protein
MVKVFWDKLLFVDPQRQGSERGRRLLLIKDEVRRPAVGSFDRAFERFIAIEGVRVSLQNIRVR